MTHREQKCFQAHLERLSDYLMCGEKVWWHYDDENEEIVFHDGSEEPSIRSEGPELMSFVNFQMHSIPAYLNECWKKCIDEEVLLPIQKIRLYAQNGDYVSEKHFRIGKCVYDVVNFDENIGQDVVVAEIEENEPNDNVKKIIPVAEMDNADEVSDYIISADEIITTPTDSLSEIE